MGSTELMADREINRRVTGVLLCGGSGRRFQGADKPLLMLGDRSLAARVAERLAGQVDALLVSANRNQAAYEALGYPVVGDRTPGLGPLAGVVAGAARAETDLLLVCPGDAPELPTDLCVRLCARLTAGVDAALPHDGERAQVLFLLVRREVALSAEAYLDQGGRSVQGWLAGLRVAEVPIPEPAAFLNVNTPEELARLARDVPG
jgi:molybdopterin-guanine dinucleotide biosynthesis protein A